MHFFCYESFPDDFFEFFGSYSEIFSPFMLASDANSNNRYMSEEAELPTITEKNGLSFFATTKTLELIAPIARKHIAVTNVFKGNVSAQGGDTDCINCLKAANSAETFNRVIDGTERIINAEHLTPGYTYEIAYSILDYKGNISTRKYYVKIS